MNDGFFRFRLYVAGGARNSLAAIDNLRALCDRHLPGRHEIEVIDLLREPRRGIADNIMMTPMLIKLAPAPTLRILGSLDDAAVMLRELGLPAPGA